MILPSKKTLWCDESNYITALVASVLVKVLSSLFIKKKNPAACSYNRESPLGQKNNFLNHVIDQILNTHECNFKRILA